MSDLEETRAAGIGAPEQAAAEAPLTTAPPSGPQPLRPTVPVHAVPRPQAPIRRPEPETRPRFGRTVHALKTLLPLLPRVLPLLEGNIASTVVNLLAPLPPAPSAGLEPVERALRGVHTEIEVLRTAHGEHTAVLKRLDEQLSDLRDAADRQSARQVELVDEVHSLRGRITVIAVIGLLMLAATAGLSVFLALKTGAFSR